MYKRQAFDGENFGKVVNAEEPELSGYVKVTYSCEETGETWTEWPTADEMSKVFSYSVSRAVGEEVGEYTMTITAQLLNDHATSGNYVIEVGEDEVFEITTIGTITGIDATLRLRSEVQINVLFNYEGFEGLDNITERMGLLVWKDNSRPMAECDITNADFVMPGGEFDEQYGKYVVRSQGISAKNMGDDLWFKIYIQTGGDTYVYSPRFKYSPQTYCVNAVKDATADPELKTLCVALMNYGADAQKYFAMISNYTYTTLMNEKAEFDPYRESVKAYDQSMITALGDKNASKHGEFVYEAGYVKSASPFLSLTGALSLNLTINCVYTEYTDAGLLVWKEASYNDLTELTWENADANIKSDTVGAESYNVRYTGIAAKDMGNTVYACAYIEVDGEYKYSGIFTYSIERFAEQAIGEAISDEFTAVMKSMVVYGDHAKTYFAKN